MRTIGAILLLVLAPAVFAGEYEFYWDNGVSGYGVMPWWEDGLVAYVLFDEEMTTGQPGTVTSLGAYVTPNWPDGTYQGAYLHVLGDSDGLPGDDLESVYMSGPGWQWTDVNVELDEGIFWIAFEWIGHYPNCDGLGFDNDGGTGHTYVPGMGGWIEDMDAMLRCYWEGERIQVVESSWGRIKALW
jgi:hypothetical protein